MSLSLKERATNYETFLHIERVRNLLNIAVQELLRRGELHDQSKLDSPEVEYFTKAPDLKDLSFDSEEYEASKEALEECLIHHYAKNRHHPQHFKNGMHDMNLIDLLEMFVDWKASSERQHDGNLRKSIEVNAEKFEMPEMLVNIFENTIEVFEE